MKIKKGIVLKVLRELTNLNVTINNFIKGSGQRDAELCRQLKNIVVENVRAEKTEKGELKKENDELRKANQATSEKFQESVRQFVKELQYAQSVIYDLRWNRHLSQAKIVVECSRLKITGCRTKKRVGELLAGIIAILHTRLILRGRIIRLRRNLRGLIQIRLRCLTRILILVKPEGLPMIRFILPCVMRSGMKAMLMMGPCQGIIRLMVRLPV